MMNVSMMIAIIRSVIRMSVKTLNVVALKISKQFFLSVCFKR
jgi:hypothetical protein